MSLNLTIPTYRASLVAELAAFSKDYISFDSSYGGNRHSATVKAHFFRLGINCTDESFRHYLPKEALTKDYITGLIARYRDEALSGFNLDIIRQGNVIFIHDGDHILVVGELFGDNPAFRTISWVGHAELVRHLKDKMDEDGSNRIPVMNRLFTSTYGVLDTPISLPEFAPTPDECITYPFLGQTAAELWDAFAASSSNVMILIGPPGTGKSSLIRAMLNHRGWDDNAYLADSTDTIMHPNFVERIRTLPRGSVVVTEDSDQLLESRDNGNTAMATLLNATSGLASTDTKFLIGTNLPSLNNTDSAILRRGRLFKVLAFRKLSLAEAAAVRAMMGKSDIDLSVLGDTVSLADALNYELTDTIEPVKRSAGFL